MTLNPRNAVGLLLLCGIGALVFFFSPNDEYGAWSLLPAAVTIAVCFSTGNILLALLLGVAAGGLVSGQLNLITAYLVPSLGSEKYAQILLVYLWALGALLGLWNRNGGARHFAATFAAKFVHSRSSAKFFAWCLGVLFHQGGTISTVLTGTTVKPVSDQHKVSHEELSYVVDSTASPVATLIPFNVWPVYIAGLITLPSLAHIIPNQEMAIGLFMQAIPFNFYAWLAVLMTLLLALDKLKLVGPMAKAVARVKSTGELDRSDAEPIISDELGEEDIPDNYQPSSLDFWVPISVLMGFCILPWISGGSPMVFEGFGMAVVSGLATTLVRGMSVNDAFYGVIQGIKGVTLGAVILGLAVTLAAVAEDLNTSDYVISVVSDTLTKAPFLLPSLLMLICMITAFSIGSSWGTYAVVFPIAMPLVYVISPDPTFLVLNFGAVLGGAVFGDQCSPISDTTVLSALACGADVMDHVKSQLPLACIAAALASALYVLASLIIL